MSMMMTAESAKAKGIPRRREPAGPQSPRRLTGLVDTSIWIGFLTRREPYAAELDPGEGRSS
jgi:hypothetical protein